VVVLDTRGVEARRLFDLQLWTVSQGISTWLIDLNPYEECRVAGIVRQLRIDPRAGVIEAVIADGTGTVLARWAIRRPAPELAVSPGRAVVLEGLSGIGPDGEPVLRNPSFQLRSFPDIA
jgi:hypothetical protein